MDYLKMVIKILILVISRIINQKYPKNKMITNSAFLKSKIKKLILVNKS